MSTAKPMTALRRWAHCGAQRGTQVLTPAQYRRYRHKWNQTDGDAYYVGFGGKGTATPRQRRPRRG